MSAIKIKWNPTKRELRQFGVIWSVFFSGVAGLIWYRKGDFELAAWIWAAAIAAALVGFLWTPFMRLLFVGMSTLAYPIGWVISHLILASIYYFVLTPIGLILRIMRRDPLERRIDRTARSYWVPLTQTKDSRRYFRQF